MAAASANPTAARHELLLILVKDNALPADTRMAIARKSFPARPSRSAGDRAEKFVALTLRPKEGAANAKVDRSANIAPLSANGTSKGAKTEATTFATLDLLMRVAQDAASTPAERRKAGSGMAEYFLPKNPRGKKLRPGKFPPDEYGFVVDPNLARELRDNKLRLACLPLAKKLTPDAIAQKAAKLQARIRDIQQSLQCPCPSKYGLKQLEADNARLDVLGRGRAKGQVFPPGEDEEEAIRTARYDSFFHGSEIAALRRLAILREKKRAADRGYGPLLTPVEETNFRFLFLLYSVPLPAGPDERTLEDHPFQDPRFIVGNPNYPDGHLIFASLRGPTVR